MNALASLSPELRATILAAYRAWLRTTQQLALFDDLDERNVAA